jgi:hypothetical protein
MNAGERALRYNKESCCVCAWIMDTVACSYHFRPSSAIYLLIVDIVASANLGFLLFSFWMYGVINKESNLTTL